MGPDFEIDEALLTARPSPNRRRWQMSVRGLMKLILYLGCGLGLLMMLGEAVSCRVPRQAICANNLKQIALALHNYHERFGSFPPAYIPDASGRPMHSWRVLILPFLEEEPLYDKYDFREPWNGPNNIKLLNSMPHIFACPSRPSNPANLTSYVAITGPSTMFPGATSVKFTDVTDGVSQTVMVVETANISIPWSAPVDLDIRTMSLQINDPKNPAISSKHPGGANIVCGDGWSRFFYDTLAPTRLRSLITIDGGDGDHHDDDPRSF
jgi:Protein of unknown function (DUF1559)